MDAEVYKVTVFLIGCTIIAIIFIIYTIKTLVREHNLREARNWGGFKAEDVRVVVGIVLEDRIHLYLEGTDFSELNREERERLYIRIDVKKEDSEHKIIHKVLTAKQSLLEEAFIVESEIAERKKERKRLKALAEEII